MVMETASESAGVRDYTVKRRIYERMRASEYWRFAPSGGQYQDAPLAGDILSDGEYRRIAITVEPDGTFWGYSPTLALYPVWDDGSLRFYSPAIRDFLPTPSEYKREPDEAPRGRRTRRENHVRTPSGRRDSPTRKPPGGLAMTMTMKAAPRSGTFAPPRRDLRSSCGHAVLVYLLPKQLYEVLYRPLAHPEVFEVRPLEFGVLQKVVLLRVLAQDVGGDEVDEVLSLG